MSPSLLAARPAAVLAIQARVEIARQRAPQRGEPAPLAVLMAERLVEHENERGAGTEGDLGRDGFTTAEILEHGPEAKRLAARLAARRALRGQLDRAA